MKKKAGEFKVGEKIVIAGKICIVEGIEFSQSGGKSGVGGKQDSRKCRIEAKTASGERIVIIRPEGYPLEAV